MTRLRDRPTADLVVIILALVIAFVITVSVTGAVVGAIVSPDVDVTNVSKAVADLTGTLVAGVIGYLAGRGVNGSSGES